MLKQQTAPSGIKSHLMVNFSAHKHIGHPPYSVLTASVLATSLPVAKIRLSVVVVPVPMLPKNVTVLKPSAVPTSHSAPILPRYAHCAPAPIVLLTAPALYIRQLWIIA
jgi:hypothetical protein